MYYGIMRRGISGFKILLIVHSILFLVAGCKKNPEDIYKKAMELYQAGKYQKAVQAFEQILTSSPEHSLTLKARYQLGNIYLYKLSQPEKALKYAQELYAQAPQGKYSISALELIGYIYDKSLNRCLEGVEAYRELIRDYPSEIEAGKYQLAIAECYFRLSNYEQAIAEYEVLVEQYSDTGDVARAQFQIASSYALTEAYDKAIERYETLLQSDTLSKQNVADTKLELAYCYTQNEQFTEALERYEELLKLESASVSIDSELIMRKREQVLKRIEESNRKPGKVKW
jgi:tetratricopeptide (TPR) repeat protein